MKLPKPEENEKISVSKREKFRYLRELNVDEENLEKFSKFKREKPIGEVKYTIYESSRYARVSNYFMGRLSSFLTKKFQRFFQELYKYLRSSDIKVLSKSYVGISLFSSLISALIIVGGMFFYFDYIRKTDILTSSAQSLIIGILGFVLVFFLFYLYPMMVVGGRERAIKNDLPFAIIHMSAVAGSGAQPIAMFNLILETGEYKGLEAEIKKIVNYVNLFGYNLTNALKQVANTTPSKDFKELLNGIIASIETGGDLKAYLKGKADDAMTGYKLERKKYVETLSTYSDIYTAILIAAPLLFITTLAIINILGGGIGGVSVQTLSFFGTYLAIPFLNIAFIIFLSITQPEV